MTFVGSETPLKLNVIGVAYRLEVDQKRWMPQKRERGRRQQRAFHAVRHLFPQDHSGGVARVSARFRVVGDFLVEELLDLGGRRETSKYFLFPRVKVLNHFTVAVTCSESVSPPSPAALTVPGFAASCGDGPAEQPASAAHTTEVIIRDCTALLLYTHGSLWIFDWAT